MGEAKRRREVDPNYGKPKRGLIISPPMEISGTKIFIKYAGIDEQELRASLLFWDRLMWPLSRAIHIPSGPDEEFLEKEGILVRPDYTVYGDAATGVASGYLNAFQDMNRKEPGSWAMMNGESSLVINGVDLRNSGTAVELLRALPVPDKAVPLAEILEFKLKRSDQLLQLRSHIDGLVPSLNSATDRTETLNAQLTEIDEACRDVLRVCGEWQFPVRLSSLKTNVELRPFVTLAGGLGSALTAQNYGLPLAGQIISGMLGAAAATAPALKISADIGWRGLRRPSSPFRYVASYHNEVF